MASVDLPSSKGKVDVHHHIVPAFFREAVEAAGDDPSGWTLPHWSEETAISTMDALGIAKAYVSVTAPGATVCKGQGSRALARQINEFSFELAQRHPTRFGYFASLPDLVDVDGAVREVDYAHSELHADGFILFTSYVGVGEDPHEPRYLGHRSFEPLWRRLNDLRAVVFVHPGPGPESRVNKFMPAPAVDFPHETARTACDLVTSGVRTRYPNVKIILSHGGGTLASVVDRLALVVPLTGCTIPPPQLLAGFRSFYYDTALTGGASAVAGLLELADPDKILYGCDYPYAPASAAAFVDTARENYLRKHGHEGLIEQINHGNVAKLFRTA